MLTGIRYISYMGDCTDELIDSKVCEPKTRKVEHGPEYLNDINVVKREFITNSFVAAPDQMLRNYRRNELSP